MKTELHSQHIANEAESREAETSGLGRRKRPAFLDNAKRKILHGADKRGRDVVSISIREGIRGPADLTRRDRPNFAELPLDGIGEAVLLDELSHRGMDDMYKEIADYLGRGGTIKLGRGFSKTSSVVVPRKK